MEAKLIFDEDYYILQVANVRIGDIIVASSDHGLSKMINHPFKLSLSNCEEIRNGYDLDKTIFYVEVLMEDELTPRFDSDGCIILINKAF